MVNNYLKLMLIKYPRLGNIFSENKFKKRYQNKLHKKRL